MVTSGVRRGHFLALPFVVFINDIKDCFHYTKFLLYGDDLTIYDSVLLQEDSGIFIIDYYYNIVTTYIILIVYIFLLAPTPNS